MRAVESLGERGDGWQFMVTGEVPDHVRAAGAGRVEFVGLQASPFDAIKPARAVALMSDLGRGFKTKIIESILSRNFVLVTANLFARLPDAVRPFCLLVDPDRPTTFAAALKRCLGPLMSG